MLKVEEQVEEVMADAGASDLEFKIIANPGDPVLFEGTFGERLRLLREEKKLAQKEIAALLKVSQSSIGKYENNERTPYPTSVTEIVNL